MHRALSEQIFIEQTSVLTPEYCSGRSWGRNRCEYPIVDVTFTGSGRIPLRIQLDCTDFDEHAPSVSLLSADGSPLTSLKDRRYNSVFNEGPHQNTQRPFICMRGAREYHTHPSHLTDYWEALRWKADYTLVGLLYQLHMAWLKEGA